MSVRYLPLPAVWGRGLASPNPGFTQLLSEAITSSSGMRATVFHDVLAGTH